MFPALNCNWAPTGRLPPITLLSSWNGNNSMLLIKIWKTYKRWYESINILLTLLKFTHICPNLGCNRSRCFWSYSHKIYNLGHLLSDLNSSNTGQNYTNRNIYKATEGEKKSLQNIVSIFSFPDEIENEQLKPTISWNHNCKLLIFIMKVSTYLLHYGPKTWQHKSI